jgi:succinate dehydrogenase / fumarate reductase cytochrome b subunit
MTAPTTPSLPRAPAAGGARPARPARPASGRTLLGYKIVMATSGLMLLAFVVLHLLGNLKVFEGPAAYNAYAAGLRTLGAPIFGRGQLLWLVRLALLAAVAAHLWAAAAVTRASWRARPLPYRRLETVETTYAARTMRWGGVVILLYVIYHLLDFTFGRVNPSFVPGDVYHNVLASFRVWPVAAAYIIAMVAVGLHVYHGLWSAFQTLGWNRPPTFSWRRSAAAVVAALIAGGYIAIPAAVLAGVLH